MRFDLTVNLDNAAFEDNNELAAILCNLADRLTMTDDREGTVRDHNGNTVGRWSFTSDDE